MYQTTENRSTAMASHSCTIKALLSLYFLFTLTIQLSAQDQLELAINNNTILSQKTCFTNFSVLKQFPDIKWDSLPKGIGRNTDQEMKKDTEIINNPNPQNIKEAKERITDPNKYSLSKDQIKSRIRLMTITNIGGYSAAMAGLYAAWYKNYPQTHFHSFKDIGEWKGMDKIGHAYSAYAESKASMELWRWTGIGRNKRIWLGGMSGAFYQTVIETLDGFSAEWGWSWGDFTANIFGSGMLVAQEFAWDEQRIQLKFSFHKKKYADPSLNKRSDEIFGKSGAERFLKDYNSHTYWLSANLKSFFPKSKLPAWLQISLGSGAEGLFGANNNVGKDAMGNINFNRTDIKRYRQWYLAPDIDLTKIKTKHKGIKVALNILNIVKFPMPSIEYSNGRFRFNALTF